MIGTIFDVKHFAVHDGPGIRQTIFFKGCPLNCWWCHNPESQNPKPEKYIQTNKLDGKKYSKEVIAGYQISIDNLFNTIIKDKIFFEESGGGVTFSGGEPLFQDEFLFNILKKCNKAGIHTTVDTSGFSSEKVIKKIASLTDLFLFDLKIIDNSLHKKYTGVPVHQILENIKFLDSINANIIIRFPVIPNITNTDKNISDIKNFIKTLKNINEIDILPYHNISVSKYKRFNMEYKMKDTTKITDKEMQKLKAEFEDLGLKVQIGG